ncbi:division/cell wall cluster transcriptional repressor MraZ [Bacteroidetes bacterium SCGC AAA795-G10]|nr:division/cell wall cluster transcriptional repressor MraZ [Bacteroidetes bacterium SCGC AAA795-G10]
MEHLIGTYECKVDTKGRVMMPIALKKQLSKLINEGFVLKRSVFNHCIEMYPLSEWSKLMDKLNGLNRFNKKNNDFIRRFTAGVKSVEMDNSGRFLISKDLIKHASIDKEIVVSSSVNILEIWNKSTYEKVINETTLNFGALAEEVMGDKNYGSIS